MPCHTWTQQSLSYFFERDERGKWIPVLCIQPLLTTLPRKTGLELCSQMSPEGVARVKICVTEWTLPCVAGEAALAYIQCLTFSKRWGHNLARGHLEAHLITASSSEQRVPVLLRTFLFSLPAILSRDDGKNSVSYILNQYMITERKRENKNKQT